MWVDKVLGSIPRSGCHRRVGGYFNFWSGVEQKLAWNLFGRSCKVFSSLFPMALCFPLPASCPGFSLIFSVFFLWDTLPTFELNFADSLPPVISPNTLPCGLTFFRGQLDQTTPHSTHFFYFPSSLPPKQSTENFEGHLHWYLHLFTPLFCQNRSTVICFSF